MDRRAFLGVAVGAITAVSGCTDRGGAGSYEDWFSDVDNYDGEVDRTGADRTTVRVGAGDGLDFEPAAIVVDPDATVVWEWTGKGGRHNVVERDGAFRSPYHQTQGETYERTFGSTGTVPYYCDPHRSAGMKGGVRVE